MKNSIIFLGGGPTALGGIYEIAKFYNKLYVINSEKYELARYSRYVKYLGYADPIVEQKKLFNILNDFKKHHLNYKIALIPTGDEYLDFLYNHSKELSKHFISNIFNNNAYSFLIDKEEFALKCNDLDIPIPNTWVPNDKVTIENWGGGANYPCFIKPKVYHDWKKIYGLKKGFIVYNCDELISTFNQIKHSYPDLIVQEIIEGKDSNLVVFSCSIHKNEITNIFTGRKLRQYPYGFGTTTLAISEYIPEIIEYSKRILNGINYEGVCDVEFKYDPKSREYKIIEINARIGRWYRLVTQSGKYPLTHSIGTMLKARKSYPIRKEQQNNIRWVFVLRDIFVFFRGMSLLKSLKLYFSSKVVFCVFNPKDILPSVMYFLEIFSKLLKK